MLLPGSTPSPDFSFGSMSTAAAAAGGGSAASRLQKRKTSKDHRRQAEQGRRIQIVNKRHYTEKSCRKSALQLFRRF